MEAGLYGDPGASVRSRVTPAWLLGNGHVTARGLCLAADHVTVPIQTPEDVTQTENVQVLLA